MDNNDFSTVYHWRSIHLPQRLWMARLARYMALYKSYILLLLLLNWTIFTIQIIMDITQMCCGILGYHI